MMAHIARPVSECRRRRGPRRAPHRRRTPAPGEGGGREGGTGGGRAGEGGGKGEGRREGGGEGGGRAGGGPDGRGEGGHHHHRTPPASITQPQPTTNIMLTSLCAAANMTGVGGGREGRAGGREGRRAGGGRAGRAGGEGGKGGGRDRGGREGRCLCHQKTLLSRLQRRCKLHARQVRIECRRQWWRRRRAVGGIALMVCASLRTVSMPSSGKALRRKTHPRAG